ncbi:aldo/keto reductase [Clostridium intestinale]|uniref:aldo/keto reductase n=1 Tax=Clostridium intestinale TaxID=36845 RepID=UPI0028E5550A|nr:aldo/keto reductase [Clostridium intestinale]
MEYITLNNNEKMPVFGLGTFPMKNLNLIKAVINAIDAGYRCFDVAPSYHNELALGIALKIAMLKGISRKDLFIITKVSNVDQRKGNIKKALKLSMLKLGVKYIDLYLMHWPHPNTYKNTWKQMEELYESGVVKSIGVCNFHKQHLEELFTINKITPVVNEIELHPLLTQKELSEFCKTNKINIISYSPLARMDEKLIKNPILIELSKIHKKTVPQIIFRWNLQHNYIVIPKTESKKRLKENIDIFDFCLTKEEMDIIDTINQNYRVRHNPETCDYSKV